MFLSYLNSCLLYGNTIIFNFVFLETVLYDVYDVVDCILGDIILILFPFKNIFFFVEYPISILKYVPSLPKYPPP
jgi:hypothetical protein